jgi:RNA polymerase sigma-70 factor, ECF subfamily
MSDQTRFLKDRQHIPMTDQNQAISALISRVSLGDRKAFRGLYDLTSAKLFAILLRILRNRTEAEDALQDVYVKVWNSAGSYFITQYSPMSWLIAIARNHAVDRIRAGKSGMVGIDAMAELADSAPDPERTAIATSEMRRIDGCLEQLDSAAAIRGAYLDGFSYQELSERFSVPLNTMRTWLRRGLIRLKECLEQ